MIISSQLYTVTIDLHHTAITRLIMVPTRRVSCSQLPPPYAYSRIFTHHTHISSYNFSGMIQKNISTHALSVLVAYSQTVVHCVRFPPVPSSSVSLHDRVATSSRYGFRSILMTPMSIIKQMHMQKSSSTNCVFVLLLLWHLANSGFL